MISAHFANFLICINVITSTDKNFLTTSLHLPFLFFPSGLDFDSRSWSKLLMFVVVIPDSSWDQPIVHIATSYASIQWKTLSRRDKLHNF